MRLAPAEVAIVMFAALCLNNFAAVLLQGEQPVVRGVRARQRRSRQTHLPYPARWHDTEHELRVRCGP